jgi:hypothetical protein
MSDNKTKLLLKVLNLFTNFGVIPGKGIDGQLMAEIQAEVANSPEDAPPMLFNFNPNMRMTCPLCKHPDFNECGCPADQQMAAMV